METTDTLNEEDDLMETSSNLKWKITNETSPVKFKENKNLKTNWNKKI